MINKSIWDNIFFITKILKCKYARKYNKNCLPYKVNIKVTNKCNCRCKTCNIWKIYQQSPNKIHQELNISEYNSFFKQNKNRLQWISLTGGEPFVRNDFKKIAVSAIKHCKNLIVLSINTNGFLTDKIVKDIKYISSRNKHAKLYVNIALDGDKDTHDKLRGKPGAYQRAMKTFNALKNLNLKNVSVEREITITQNNCHNIFKVINNLKDKHIITFEHSSSFYNNVEDSQFKINKILLEQLSKHNIKVNSVADLIKKRYLNLSKDYFSGKRQVLPCYSSWVSLFIDPYGNIKPCINFNQNIANIKEHDFSLLNALDNCKLDKVRRDIRNKKCPGCWTPCEAYQTILQNFL